MQGHRADARRWIVLAMSILTAGILVLMIGWSGNPAGAATDTLSACATQTPIPAGTLAAGGTVLATPSPPPPTATPTVVAINGSLLGGPTATAPSSPTPLPVCTPAPPQSTSTAAPPLATPTRVAAAYVSGGTAAVATQSSPAVRPPPTVPVKAAAAGPPRAAQSDTVAQPPSPAAPSPSSSSSGPPAAAVGLSPPPPPGYAVGNTPNSAGAADAGGGLSSVGTPVVSAARGNIAPAGAVSIPFPGSAPVPARLVAPPGYAIGPTGAPLPVVTPRAGHPQSARGANFALLLLVGTICVIAGMWMRGLLRHRAVRA